LIMPGSKARCNSTPYQNDVGTPDEMISRLDGAACARLYPCFACALTSANEGVGFTVYSYSLDIGLVHPLLPSSLFRRTQTSYARPSVNARGD